MRVRDIPFWDHAVRSYILKNLRPNSNCDKWSELSACKEGKANVFAQYIRVSNQELFWFLGLLLFFVCFENRFAFARISLTRISSLSFNILMKKYNQSIFDNHSSVFSLVFSTSKLLFPRRPYLSMCLQWQKIFNVVLIPLFISK